MSELKAFPHTFPETTHVEWGMDLRDYFAAKAMQAFVAKFDTEIPEYKIAEAAYWMADEMLAARERKE
jgi:hypothetical protein